ncbi:hypothetical protein HYQ44_009956 [Verticillium longisporum]|nr:hypothetical protein HYQ44_009956 [Verticillium longisporum]
MRSVCALLQDNSSRHTMMPAWLRQLIPRPKSLCLAQGGLHRLVGRAEASRQADRIGGLQFMSWLHGVPDRTPQPIQDEIHEISLAAQGMRRRKPIA